MPYCPECRDEFQEWVMVCPDCDVPLVDILPELTVDEPASRPGSTVEPSQEKLAYIATAPNESLAMLWAGILENEGIPSFIKGGDWYISEAMPFCLKL